MLQAGDAKSGEAVRWEMEEDGVALLRFYRPPLNLLSQSLRERIAEMAEEIAVRSDVRVVVVYGEGERGFCAGADMKEFPLRFDPSVAAQHSARGQRLAKAVAFLPQPSIEAIEGVALGGGFELALCCDLRIAGEDARVGLPEVHRGVFPGTGGTLLLARLVGAARAKALMWEGDILSAPRSRDEGLVNEVVPSGEALAAAIRLGRKLAALPRRSLQTIKSMADAAWRAQFERELERKCYVQIFQSADAREGCAAFFEKREPRWTHE